LSAVAGADTPHTPTRVVLIGGGALAEGLARGLAGAHVAMITSPDEPRGDGDGDALARVTCSFDSEQAVTDAMHAVEQALGGIDQVVHAWLPASVLAEVEFSSIDEAGWASGCERALEAAWWVARQAVGRLRATGGTMVFVVPTLGMSGAAGYSMLSTVAEGLRVLAKSCGRQWGSFGVTVNAIATAPHLWLDDQTGTALTKAVSLSSPAFGGPGDAALDLAPLLELLGDRRAHFLTAATLVADGGIWMGL
jgi:NAD(P)-dependent dehydrogenase (short-subunit alcohol dehydrogenase family)